MDFTGRLYFDVGSRDVWHLYRFLSAAADGGAELQLSWVPFLSTDSAGATRALASFAAVKQQATERHGAYLQALLMSHHVNGATLEDAATYSEAAAQAGIDPDLAVGAEGGLEAVLSATEEGRLLGVREVPTLYRNGPVLSVRVNPAALEGNVLDRLRRIDEVLEDDGIWALEKP